MSDEIRTRLAGIISRITDEQVRRYVAVELADMFQWGDPGFDRGHFLKAAGVEEQRSPYLVLAEEM